MLSNKVIIDKVMEGVGVNSHSQLASYLTNKHGIKIDRRQIFQYTKSKTFNLNNLLLSEILERKS